MVAVSALATLLVVAAPPGNAAPSDDPETLFARAEQLKAWGRDEDAYAAYRAAVDEFDRRQLDPREVPLAADAAAHARFQLAERQMAAFEKLRVTGSGKALAESIRRSKDAVRELHASYAEVFKYGRLDWTCAALFRQAAAMELLAGKLVAVPTPPEITRMGKEGVVAYKDALDDQARVVRGKAAEEYDALVDEAELAGAENEWTRQAKAALRRLNVQGRVSAKQLPAADYPTFIMQK
jgi:hypothetical protein